MIWNLIWIFAIFFIIGDLLYEHKRKTKFRILDYVFLVAMGIFGAFTGGTISLTIGTIINSYANTEYFKVNEKPIYCINDTSSTEGRLYLYSGYIKDKLVYRMFVDNNGGKKVLEVNSDNSTIYEDNNNIIEILKSDYTNKTVELLLGDNPSIDKYEYRIHISKGSITTEYKIDLK